MKQERSNLEAEDQEENRDSHVVENNGSHAVEKITGLITVIFLLFSGFLLFGIGIMSLFMKANLTNTFWLMLASQLTIALVGLSFYRFNKVKIREDFTLKGNSKGYLVSFIVGLLTSILVLLISFISGKIIPSIEEGVSTQTVSYFSLVIIVFIAPIVEEFTFRAGLYRMLNESKWGNLGFLIVSSLLFGALHLDFSSGSTIKIIVSLISYLIGGVMLALVFLKGKNVKYSIISHMSYNFSVVILSLILI